MMHLLGAHEPVVVLLVDDEPANVLALASVLRRPNYEIVTASSGAGALLAVLRRPPDVILLDIHMPDMDGFEAAALIRERERSSRIPILFMTASLDDMSHVFRRFPAGLVDYLRKPADADHLRAKVANFAELARLDCRRDDAPSRADGVGPELLRVLEHELRTPLVPLRVSIDDLGGELEGSVRTDVPLPRERVVSALEHIDRATTRLESAIEETLDVLRTGRPFRAPIAPAGDPGPKKTSDATRPPPSETGSGAILLVDDDEDIRDSLRDALEHRGYSVVLAEDGRAALERLRDMAPPLTILLDVMMPVMGGLEFLAALDEVERFAAVPVLLMSAAERPPSMASKRRPTFLKKPVRLDQLFAFVESSRERHGDETAALREEPK